MQYFLTCRSLVGFICGGHPHLRAPQQYRLSKMFGPFYNLASRRNYWPCLGEVRGSSLAFHVVYVCRFRKKSSKAFPKKTNSTCFMPRSMVEPRQNAVPARHVESFVIRRLPKMAAVTPSRRIHAFGTPTNLRRFPIRAALGCACA